MFSSFPNGILSNLLKATRATVAEPALKQMLIDVSIKLALRSTPDQFGRSVADDVALWAPVPNDRFCHSGTCLGLLAHARLEG
jgi:hypothetical protein